MDYNLRKFSEAEIARTIIALLSNKVDLNKLPLMSITGNKALAFDFTVCLIAEDKHVIAEAV